MHEEARHSINWWGLGGEYANSPALGWFIVTFVIFAILFVYFIKKPLSLYLEARSREIRNALESANNAKAEAIAKMKACEDRLLNLDKEIERAKIDFEKSSNLEKLHMENSLKELSKKIEKETNEAIAYEIIKAKDVIKKEAVEQAISLVLKNVSSNSSGFEESLRNSVMLDLKRISDE